MFHYNNINRSPHVCNNALKNAPLFYSETVAFTYYWKKRIDRRSVLLIGLSDSGKTVLFSRLIYKTHKDTFTSIAENSAEYLPNGTNKTLRLIDIPGDERVRTRIFETYKSKARALIFVVDSSTVQKLIRDVAEALYRVLSDKVIANARVPVLVLCNKQDLPVAKGPQVVKALLEKEINFVRHTKINQLQSIDDQVNGVVLGRSDKTFEFDQLLPQTVQFEGSSAIRSNEDSPPEIELLEEWIAAIS